MPTLLPPGGAVDWPRDEGVIGVVGVAPWATIDFLRALYAAVPATKDWHFPRVIADINTKLPSRGRHLELGETDPSPAIAQSLAELAAQGATVAVVPCNTAHILYERWAPGAPLAVPHIVEATARELHALGARRVAALSSASLRRHGLYATTLQALGLEVMDAGDDAARLVAAAIEDVKQHGRLGAAREQALRQVLRDLRGDRCEAVALGCTELASVATMCADEGLQAVDSNAALARAALRVAMQGRAG